MLYASLVPCSVFLAPQSTRTSIISRRNRFALLVVWSLITTPPNQSVLDQTGEGVSRSGVLLAVMRGADNKDEASLFWRQSGGIKAGRNSKKKSAARWEKQRHKEKRVGSIYQEEEDNV